jgi:hypothetical protein
MFCKTSWRHLELIAFYADIEMFCILSLVGE